MNLGPAQEAPAAQDAAPAKGGERVTLFRNVRIFDGRSGTLSGPADVLIRGNVIARVSAVGAVSADPAATVITGNSRVLMPGLIDAHWHAMLARPSKLVALTADLGYLNILAARQAEDTLLRGFTTVRDLGGPVFGLKRAIDEGATLGPRIYPSGAFISQTGGHGDFRLPYEVPKAPGGPLSHMEKLGAGAIADSPDEVRLRAREQLMMGASQLKLMAGGGVSSAYDPLDVTQYSEPELRAAVEAAEDWGTYVTVHVYTSRAIQRAVAAGVKCIDHGHLMDEPTARLLAQKGVWLSLQPFLDDEDANPQPDPEARKMQLEVASGTENAYALAKKYKLKVAFGTDILFDARLATRQGARLAKMVRWYTPGEVLKMATGDNAQLLALSGPRNPYPGRLGVVEEGALADLLLVNGDPVANIRLLEDAARNLLVIMKDGKVYKNLLSP
jgi:imidazolonepropionase-like amidohydrolase